MKKMSTLTQVLLAAAIGAVSFSAMAHTTAKNENLGGYVVSAQGKAVKTGTGECLRSAQFTAALATEECDPDLVPKKPAPAPAPEVKPEPTPAPTPAPVPAPVTETRKVTLEADTYFDFGKSTLKPAGKSRIDAELAKLNGKTLNGAIAIGHTDSIGTDAYNQKLSEQRAKAVKDYMVAKGVPADKITIKGMGEKQPVASNKTKDGRAKNRRVEVDFTTTETVSK
jgi:OOP family OmpA-OmpF porin